MTSSKPIGPTAVRATKREPGTSAASRWSPVTVVSGMTSLWARRSSTRRQASAAGRSVSRCTSKAAMDHIMTLTASSRGPNPPGSRPLGHLRRCRPLTRPCAVIGGPADDRGRATADGARTLDDLAVHLDRAPDHRAAITRRRRDEDGAVLGRAQSPDHELPTLVRVTFLPSVSRKVTLLIRASEVTEYTTTELLPLLSARALDLGRGGPAPRGGLAALLRARSGRRRPRWPLPP